MVGFHSPRPRRSPGLAIPALVLVLAAPASAERPRALIVGPPTGVLTALLEDEVRALGMDVEVVPSDVFPSWPELRQLAGVRGASVALAVGPQESAIGVWVIDPSTGEGSMRTVVVAPGDPGDGARVAAVRAVELVRIGLREQRGDPTASAVAIADPAVEAPALIEEPARLWLGLGAGTLWAPGGLEPSAVLAATIRYQLLEPLSLAVAVSFPLTPSDVTAAEGSATVRPWWAWLEARWTFLGDRGRSCPTSGGARRGRGDNARLGTGTVRRDRRRRRGVCVACARRTGGPAGAGVLRPSRCVVRDDGTGNRRTVRGPPGRDLGPTSDRRDARARRGMVRRHDRLDEPPIRGSGTGRA